MSALDLAAIAKAVDPASRVAPGARSASVRCPAHEDARPSLSMTVKDGRLLVHCWAGCRGRDVYAAVLRLAGLAGRRGQPIRASARPAPRAVSDIIGTPLHSYWLRAIDVADHPVARAYLTHRRCVVPPRGTALRAVDAARHPTGASWPAMVALVCAPYGRPVTLHTTFLAPDGRSKAPVEPARLFAAGPPAAGGVVRLTQPVIRPGPPVELGVAEGIESALSLAHAGLEVWACLSAGTLAGLPPPAAGPPWEITIAIDRDPAGERAARACAARWYAVGRKVRLVRPPAGDVNDFVLGMIP